MIKMIKTNIFFDTEFSHLHKKIEEIELISIGFCSEFNDRLYIELPFNFYDVSDFVRTDVIPFLNPEEFLKSYEDAGVEIKKFLGKFENPILISDSLRFDGYFFKKLIKHNDVKFENLFFLNEKELKIFSDLSEQLFNSGDFHRHHALDDAEVNCIAYKSVLSWREINSNNPLAPWSNFERNNLFS